MMFKLISLPITHCYPYYTVTIVQYYFFIVPNIILQRELQISL